MVVVKEVVVDSDVVVVRLGVKVKVVGMAVLVVVFTLNVVAILFS